MLNEVLGRVDVNRMSRDLFHTCSTPLPFRKVNHTVAGHEKCTLDEMDDFLQGELESIGLTVERAPFQIQALRCDSTKPLHHWYSKPMPEDPFHTACNLEVALPGREFPEEIIQLVSHKDSMSWIDSPGSHDNATGTIANLEIARVLANTPLKRTVRILFCNEEHTPWTSRFAADAAAQRGDRILAVLNQDSLDGKSDEDMAAGRQCHVVAYSTDEGRPLAELMVRMNDLHDIGLDASVAHKERVNDDDGMFIKAGFRTTVMNIGSWPFADSEYHLVGDTPDRVDMHNLARSARLVLATVLELDRTGTIALS